jgi:hypothetical protein
MEDFIKKLKNNYKFLIEQEAREYNHKLYSYSISQKEQRSLTKHSYLYKQELLISKYYNLSLELVDEFTKIKNCKLKPLPSFIYKGLLNYVKDDCLINIVDLGDEFDYKIGLLLQNY